MDISKQLMIGESISYAKEDIIGPIQRGEFPSRKIMWYAITDAFEKDNLFYILSGTEYRHCQYHRVKGEGSSSEKKLKILAICGSKKEAMSMLQEIIQQAVDSDSVMNLKEAIDRW